MPTWPPRLTCSARYYLLAAQIYCLRWQASENDVIVASRIHRDEDYVACARNPGVRKDYNCCQDFGDAWK
jgi:hypothetical protein